MSVSWSPSDPAVASKRRLRPAILLALNVSCLVATASPAMASPFEVYGFSARATAMGSAQGACSRDHSALYYNPANLTFRDRTHLGLGLNFVSPHLKVGTSSSYEGRPPTLPEANFGFTAGLVFPLGGVLDHRIAVGLAAFLPLVQFTRLESIDPSNPHFYIYQSLPDHVALLPGIGLELTPWLRAGASVQVLAALDANMQVSGDLIYRRIDRRSMVVEMDASYGPIIGFTITAGPVDVGLVYRDDIDIRFHFPVDLHFTGLGTLFIQTGATALYTPRQLSLGLAWNLADPSLVLAADVTLAFWSGAPSPAARIDAVMTDEDLHPEEEMTEVLFDFHTDPFVLGARDILIPRLGIEWQASSAFTLRGGLFYRPTPIPDQTGYSSVLDAQAVVLSTGGGVTFPNPFHVARQAMSVDLNVQWTHLMDRVVVKTAQDGASWEGELSAGGDVINLGLELRQDF